MLASVHGVSLAHACEGAEGSWELGDGQGDDRLYRVVSFFLETALFGV